MISRTQGENWDGTDFKMWVGTRFSEYSEWTLLGSFDSPCENPMFRNCVFNLTSMYSTHYFTAGV